MVGGLGRWVLSVWEELRLRYRRLSRDYVYIPDGRTVSRRGEREGDATLRGGRAFDFAVENGGVVVLVHSCTVAPYASPAPHTRAHALCCYHIPAYTTSGHWTALTSFASSPKSGRKSHHIPRGRQYGSPLGRSAPLRYVRCLHSESRCISLGPRYAMSGTDLGLYRPSCPCGTAIAYGERCGTEIAYGAMQCA
eukprot:1762089-Rhodomonas_salina.1